MATVQDIINFIHKFAPPESALGWDNCGLQVGDPAQKIWGVLLALDMTPRIIDEALKSKAELVITHHPLIFSPLKKIDYSTPLGSMIQKLAVNSISHFAAHTNLDRSPEGTGKAFARSIGLRNIRPFTADEGDEMNMVILGEFEDAMTEEEVTTLIKNSTSAKGLKLTGKIEKCRTVAVIPGSGGSFLRKTVFNQDLVITGEISYHDALLAQQTGIPVLALGHYNSEKPVMYHLHELMSKEFPGLNIKIAENEGEPCREV